MSVESIGVFVGIATASVGKGDIYQPPVIEGVYINHTTGEIFTDPNDRYKSLQPPAQAQVEPCTQDQADRAFASSLASGYPWEDFLPTCNTEGVVPVPEAAHDYHDKIYGTGTDLGANSSQIEGSSGQESVQVVGCNNQTGNEAVHVVATGDTLYQLSRVYGVTYEALITINPQITNPNLINPGMQINIPGNCSIALFSNAANPPNYENEADPIPIDLNPPQTEIETKHDNQTFDETPTNDNNTLVEFAKEHGTIIAGTAVVVGALYVAVKKVPGKVSQTITDRLSMSRGKRYY